MKIRMTNPEKAFDHASVLVVGGAGFIGSNLVKILLEKNSVINIIVVDNLISSEASNIPRDPRIKFIEESITGDETLKNIDDSFDYIFHLATFHGNQNSIHDPLADHENNTLTTLKLMNHVKDFKNLKKLVYSSAGCSVAEKTFDEVKPTTEDAPHSINQDIHYSISKIIGELYYEIEKRRQSDAWRHFVVFWCKGWQV